MRHFQRIILAAALVLATVSAQAQIGFGISAGSSNANYKIKGYDNAVSNEMGYQVGVSLPINLVMINITPEVWYAHNNFTIDNSSIMGSKASVKSNSIDAPIMITVPLMPILKFEAGPRFSLYSEAKATLEDGSKVNIGRINATTGYSAGLRLTILGKIVLGARYNGQFGGYDNDLKTENNYDIRTRSYALSIGFKL